MNHHSDQQAAPPSAEPDIGYLWGLPYLEAYLINAETWQIIDASESACRNVQYSAAEILTKVIQDICPSCTPTLMLYMLESHHGGNRVPVLSEVEYRRKDGSCYRAAFSLERLTNPNVLLLITEQKNVKATLKATEQWLAMVLDHIADGIITMDERGIIETFNAAASALFGYQADEAIGQNITLLIPLHNGDQDDSGLQQTTMTSQVILPGVRRREVQGLRKDGALFTLELTTSEMRQGNRRLFISIVRDITERKEIARQMEHLAHYDSLTTLPNRVFFMKHLETAISRAQRGGQLVALMFLDLDRFKEINDSFGHLAGDQILMEAATRIKNCLRARDTVARLGGDEFTVILEGVSKPKHAAAIARKILDCFNDPIVLCGQAFDVTTSIGIALYPLDAANGQDMLKAADIAMYAAKNKGRNNYQFFQPGSRQAPDQVPP